MREIKFRIWSKATKELLYYNTHVVPCLTLNGVLQDCTEQTGVSRNVSDKYILMQFTGLLDSNDVEIFEGDIVETKIGQFTYRREVFQDPCGAWCIKLPSVSSTGESTVMLIAGEYKVVGNIYENKDLII